jgi:hypothetical protein
VDKSDQLATICDVSRRTKKWAKKLFFHLTVLAIVIVLIIHRFWGIYDKKVPESRR